VLPSPALRLLASTSASLADPPGSNVLVAAVSWLQGTLLGTVATTCAILAVASVGLAMLGGRVSLRHGATVVIGCFILFGAATIAAGIQAFVGPSEGASRPDPPEPPPPPLPPELQAPATTTGNDPYAGASVPNR
jgi:type IV secretory pathway VirB2 component (pilin)